MALPQACPRSLPAKAAHFRVWLPRKNLAVTQSTCGNDTFGYCGLRHYSACGRAPGHAILVANASGTAYRSNRNDSIPAVRLRIAAKLLAIISLQNHSADADGPWAQAGEVRGADAANVTQAWFYRGKF